MEKIESKMIKIGHYGPIMIKGGAYGPIDSAYKESTNTIFKMLSAGIKGIVEVLPDGTEVKLDASNFDKDNTPDKAVPPDKTVPPVTPPAANNQTAATGKNPDVNKVASQTTTQEKKDVKVDSIESK